MARQRSPSRSRSSPAKPRPNKRTRGRRTRAGKRRASANARRGAPAWVWFVSGLGLATAGAAVFYIGQQPAGITTPPTVESGRAGNGGERDETASADRQPRDKAQAASAKPESEPRFSFYKMLPNYEASVERGAPAQRAGDTGTSAPPARRAGQGQATSQPAQQPAQPAPAKQAAEPGSDSSGSGSYVLQAGAFSSRDDADRRAARLTLLGINASVVATRAGSGKTVYRVQSQPINTQRRVDTLQKRLAGNNIDTMVRHAGR